MIFKILYRFLTIVWVVHYILHPTQFASNTYPFIAVEDILYELHYSKIIPDNTQLQNCNVSTILSNPHVYDTAEIFEPRTLQTLREGGEYFPKLCNTNFSVAIIVPYRNRKTQLKVFLNYMHFHLQTQNIHYRIFIVEQNDTKPFNRAKLMNIGAIEALKLGYPCLILHDIDLIPVNSANLYVCTKFPRHMSTNLDLHRYHLLYDGLFGGAAAIQSTQFELINGMSNMFFGWGGEDDDFYMRLSHCNLEPCRYDPAISKYIMLKHRKEIPSEERYAVLRMSLHRYHQDGINSIDSIYTISLESHFTHILVSHI